MQACRILPNQMVMLNQWTTMLLQEVFILHNLKNDLGLDAVKNIIKENQLLK